MLRMDNANSNLQVNVIPMENTDGYYVRGSLGLNGTITRPKPDVDEWLFTGQFEFPSSGYKIERMYYSKLADVGIAQTSPPKESEKALTVITISIAAPRPGAPDVKEVTKTPISLNIKAEKTAQFMVMMGSSW